MPLKKVYDKAKSRCKVTFSLAAEEAGEPAKLFLAGDFNDWDPRAKAMRKSGGLFSASVELEAGRQYQYRFVTDQGVWMNDTEADLYVYSAFADSDNSVAAL
jgi:Carbohydrate-binding module 48 (Isoamylase N-terminal domain).